MSRVIPIPYSIKTTELSNTLTPIVANKKSKLPTVSNIKSKLPNLPTVSNIKKFAGNLGLDTVSKFHDGIISNILSRIIIISISFIIFEKLLEEKKKKKLNYL